MVFVERVLLVMHGNITIYQNEKSWRDGREEDQSRFWKTSAVIVERKSQRILEC